MYHVLIVTLLGVLLQGCASAPPHNALQPTAQKLLGKRPYTTSRPAIFDGLTRD